MTQANPNAAIEEAVIEIVTFKLNAGVSDADYVAASKKTEDFVQALEGFIDRRLSVAEDGTWTDYVVWADMAAAQTAAKAFVKAACAAEMMQMIDPATLSMRHDSCLWSMGA